MVAATALALTLSTRLYAAFQSYTDFLVQGGIFHWLCFEEEIKLDLNGEPYCSAQLDSIRSLIEFQSGAEFVGSAIAGVIMDVYSPFSLLQVGGVRLREPFRRDILAYRFSPLCTLSSWLPVMIEEAVGSSIQDLFWGVGQSICSVTLLCSCSNISQGRALSV